MLDHSATLLAPPVTATDPVREYAGGSLAAGEISGMSVKAVGWAFLAGSIGFATASLVSNAVLVTKVYFAREVLSIAATLAQAFDSLVGATASPTPCAARWGTPICAGGLASRRAPPFAATRSSRRWTSTWRCTGRASPSVTRATGRRPQHARSSTDGGRRDPPKLPTHSGPEEAFAC